MSAAPLWVLAFAAGLLATGALAGLLAGLLGVGGGIVVVPVLFHIFTALEIDPAIKMHLAVGTSLATIVPTAFISARAHHRRGSVDAALLRRWAPAVALGAVAGTVLAGSLKSTTMTAVFAVVALAVSAHMALHRDAAALAPRLPAAPAQTALALVIGAVSAVMGIGGGTLSVPILTAFSYPIRQAVGTAAALGLVIAVPGALGFALAGWDRPSLPFGSLGYVNLIGVALIIPATMTTAPLGSWLAHRIGTGALRRVFALFLFLTALRMLAGLG